MNSSVAVIDASIVYGASRWYRGVHDDPTWQYSGQFRPSDDRRHFLEFLHCLLLYDRILIDDSSVTRTGDEIRLLFAKVNAVIGFQLLGSRRLVDKGSAMEVVRETVCQLVQGTLEGGIHTKDALLNIHIPWSYKSRGHTDFDAFNQLASINGLDEDLVPVAIFAYRGLCYSGFANKASHVNSVPTIYLAAPGRMQVLSKFLDARDVNTLKFPTVAYRDLVDRLRLPSQGYDFSHIRTISAGQLSKLAMTVANEHPKAALRTALTLRSSDEARSIREEWGNRIWARSLSCAVGSAGAQSIDQSNIHGNVNQIMIHGASEDFM